MGHVTLLKLLLQASRRVVLPRLTTMRKTAWIWLAGCIAWTVDGVVNLAAHAQQHAELGFLVALLFGIAWLFYRNQPR